MRGPQRSRHGDGVRVVQPAAGLRGEEPQLELDDLGELACCWRLRGLGMSQGGVGRLMGKVGHEIREERHPVVERGDGFATVEHHCAEKHQVGGRQRTALELYQFEDFSYAEIAAEMDMSPKAAKSLLYRARNQLRANLTRVMETP